MCGIAGAVWTKPDSAVSLETLERMTDVLRHRGPDDAGHRRTDLFHRPAYDSMPGTALGFRRLSIIDLAGGHQPMSNEDGSVWIVFNGEIYNFSSLRRRLEGAGHRFKTDSDTETIVHLYEDEGLDAFGHLNGMFAIAIWDANHRRLVLARDRLGEKPLVYKHEPGRILFASELKSLLEVPGIERTIDPAAVDAYLTYQYVPHPKTIFRGIRKLPPAHLAVWCDDRLEVRPYWSPRFDQEFPGTQQEAVDEVRERLTTAVTMRMRSDVPLGAFLSGGVDSSLVAAIMQKHSSTPIKTFTIGFPEKEFDERHHARAIAQHIGSEHHEEIVTPRALDILEKLAWHYDEPFADSSAIPTWYLAEMTKRSVTVALSGDGGDELFLGYSRYKAVRFASRLDAVAPLRTLLAARLWQSLPSSGKQKSMLRQFKRFSESLRMEAPRRYYDWISIFNETRRGDLYTNEFMEQLGRDDPFSLLGSAWRRSKNRASTSCAAIADLTTYLPCDLMTKVDIATMAHSLEARAPFLDHHLVEFATSLPAAFHFHRGRGKRMLERAFGQLVPAWLFSRPKMGFGVPLDSWFRNDLAPLLTELQSECALTRIGWFRPEAIRQIVREHQTKQFDHSARLWALVMLQAWLERWG